MHVWVNVWLTVHTLVDGVLEIIHVPQRGTHLVHVMRKSSTLLPKELDGTAKNATILLLHCKFTMVDALAVHCCNVLDASSVWARVVVKTNKMLLIHSVAHTHTRLVKLYMMRSRFGLDTKVLLQQ